MKDPGAIFFYIFGCVVGVFIILLIRKYGL